MDQFIDVGVIKPIPKPPKKGFMFVGPAIDLYRIHPSSKGILDSEFRAEMVRLARKMSWVSIDGKSYINRPLMSALIEVFMKVDYTAFGSVPSIHGKDNPKSRVFVLKHPDVEYSTEKGAKYEIRTPHQGRTVLFCDKKGERYIPVTVGRNFDRVAFIPHELTDDNVENIGKHIDEATSKKLFANIKTAFYTRFASKDVSKDGVVSKPSRRREDALNALDAKDMAEYPAVARTNLSRAPKVKDRYIDPAEWQATLTEASKASKILPTPRKEPPSALERLFLEIQRDYLKLRVTRDILKREFEGAKETVLQEVLGLDEVESEVVKQEREVAKRRRPLHEFREAQEFLADRQAMEKIAKAYAEKIPENTKTRKEANYKLKRRAAEIARLVNDLERRAKDLKGQSVRVSLAQDRLKSRKAAAERVAMRLQKAEEREAKIRVLFTKAAEAFANHERAYGQHEDLPKAQMDKIWRDATKEVQAQMRSPYTVLEAPAPTEVIPPSQPIILQERDVFETPVGGRRPWWTKTSGNRRPSGFLPAEAILQ